MPEIDDKFVDVVLPDQPEYVFGDLGVSMFADLGKFYDEVTPEMTWEEIDQAIDALDAAEAAGNPASLHYLITRIFDQGREGSCVANATCQAAEIVQASQFGKDNVVHLSAMSLYKRIGRSANSGAMVSDGLEELQARGALPLDTSENRQRFGDLVMPNTGFRTPFPKDWETTGALFKGIEAHPIRRSVRGLFTACCNGHPVGMGREGHSLVYLRPVRVGGQRRLRGPNSWGQWGAPICNLPFP